jgi:hypothetical protein
MMLAATGKRQLAHDGHQAWKVWSLYKNMTKKMTIAKVHSKRMQKATKATMISIKVGMILNSIS